MATPTQFGFDLKEVTKALIKEQNLHEGRWLVVLEFNFGAGLFGSSPTETLPSAFVQVKRVLLAQAEATTPEGLVVDAAHVNPMPTPEPSTVKSSASKSK
jgi:hypothetical protein